MLSQQSGLGGLNELRFSISSFSKLQLHLEEFIKKKKMPMCRFHSEINEFKILRERPWVSYFFSEISPVILIAAWVENHQSKTLKMQDGSKL